MLIYDWTKNGEQVSQSVVNRGTGTCEELALGDGLSRSGD